MRLSSGFVPVQRLRRKSLFLKALTSLLCALLAVPAPLLAQAPTVATPASQTTAPQAALAPVSVPSAATAAQPQVDTRKTLRHALHLASWQMAYLIEQSAPNFKKLKIAEHYQLLAPYQHCGSPFEKIPTNLQELDATIIVPVQTATAAFLKEHKDDAGQLTEDYDLNTGLNRVELVAAANGFKCEPRIGRAELSTKDSSASQVAKMAELVAKVGGGLPAPYFHLLRSKHSQPLVSDPELRLWMGWLHAVRSSRGVMAKFFRARDGVADSTPMPDLKVEWFVGKKLQKTFEFELDRRLTRPAEAGAGETPLALSEAVKAPSFVPCKEAGQESESQWCFKDFKEKNPFSIDEELLFDLKSHGKQLNALRKLSIHTLLTELYTVNYLLGEGQGVALPNACRATHADGNADMADLENYFETASKVDPLQTWAVAFSEAVEKLVASYERGQVEVPLPSAETLFQTGQALVETALTEHLDKNLIPAPVPVAAAKTETEVPPAKEATEPAAATDKTTAPAADTAAPKQLSDEEYAKLLEDNAKKQQEAQKKAAAELRERTEKYSAMKRADLLAFFHAFPFAKRLYEADTEAGKGTYTALLAEKLYVWYATHQDEMGVWPEKERRNQIALSLRTAIELTLSEALELYLFSALGQDRLSLPTLKKEWRQKFAPQWKKFLSSEAAQPEIARLATEITDALLAQELTKIRTNAPEISDQALAEYVRKAEPMVQKAAKAEDTIRYMTELLNRKNSAWNLVPSPLNFHWQQANQAGRDNPTHAPLYCLVDDGYRHGTGYTLDLPDARKATDHLFIKGALGSLAMRRRDALIERLKKRGYTDENVRSMYGTTVVDGKTVPAVRNVGVLADMVIGKFKEILEATEMGDRGRVATARTESLAPLRAWMAAPASAKEYKEATKRNADRIFESYFRPLLELEPTGEEGRSEWSARLWEVADTVYRNETYLKKPDAQQIYNTYKDYQRREKSSRTGYLDLRVWLSAQGEKVLTLGIIDALSDIPAEKARGNAAWKKLAENKTQSEAWLKEAVAPLRDATQMEGLFAYRVNTFTALALKKFLKHFGANAPTAYEPGKPVFPIIRRTALNDVRQDMLAAWFGEPLSQALGGKPEDLQAFEKEIDEFLAQVSLQRFTAGKDNTRVPMEENKFIQLTVEGLAQKIPTLFKGWHTRTLARVDFIEKALAAIDTQTDFAAPAQEANALFSAEYRFNLQGPTEKTEFFAGGDFSGKGRFLEDIRTALFPSFGEFRFTLEDKLKSVQAPAADMNAEAEAIAKEIRDLKVQMHVIRVRAQEKSWFNLLEGALDVGNWGRAPEDTQEFKTAERNLLFAEARLASLETRRKDYFDLQRYVRNYLGGLPIAASVAALSQQEKEYQALWNAYTFHEFFGTHSDAEGKAMALTPGEVLSDLNQLARLAKRPHLATGTTAVAFLNDVKLYCTTGLSEAHRQTFEARYSELTKKDLETLASPAVRQALSTNGTLPFEGALAAKRLFRLWLAKQAGGVETLATWQTADTTLKAKFTEFQNALKTPNPNAATTELIPTVANLCEWLGKESAALLPAAEKARSEEQAQFDAVTKKLKSAPQGYLTAKQGEVDTALKDIKSVEPKPFVFGMPYARYWTIAQLATDVFLSPQANFAPIHTAQTADAAPKAEDSVFLWHSPATQIESLSAFTSGFDFAAASHGRGVRDIKAATEFLKTWASLPSQQEAFRKGDGSDGTAEWLNALSPQARVEVATRIVTKLGDMLEAPAAERAERLNQLGYFKGRRVPEVETYSAWHRRLRAHLLYWDSMKGKYRTDKSVFQVTDHPLFSVISQAIFREFTQFTSYRLKEGHLAFSESPEKASEAFAAFLEMPPQAQRQAVEDIENLYITANKNSLRSNPLYSYFSGAKTTAETASTAKPFYNHFKSHREEPITDPRLMRIESGDEALLTFFAENLLLEPQYRRDGAEPTAAELQYAGTPIDQWLSYSAARSYNGDRIDQTDFSLFLWNLSLENPSNRESERFATWLSSLTQMPGIETLFAQLKAQATKASTDENELAPNIGTLGEPARKHLWDLYPTLADLRTPKAEQPALLEQLEGLLRTADANVPAEMKPKSYALFLSSLSWNLHEYGSAPVILSGQSPNPLPPHDKVLAALVGDLAEELAIDRKSFANWVNPLRKFPDPSDLLAIAQEQKNGLIGVGEGRMLSTRIPTPYVVAPYVVKPVEALGASYSYRPFPILDRLERIQLGSTLSYDEYRARAENPEYIQNYRMGDSDASTRQLYQQLLMTQSEMLGEKDLQIALAADRNPLEHRRFAERPENWQSHTFGNVAMAPARVARATQTAKAAGLAASEQELADIALQREALVDFRSTLSELNLRYSHEAYGAFGGESDAISPDLKGLERLWEGTKKMVGNLAPGKGNALSQRWHFGSDVFAALEQFAAQMGAKEEFKALAPEIDKRNSWWNQFLTTGNGEFATVAAAREENLAFAFYHAGQFAKKRLFKPGLSADETDRLQKLIAVIDDLYRVESQKTDFRRGIRAIAKNLSTHLTRLCGLRSLETIGESDEEFRKAESFIRDEARLTAYDGMAQVLFVESGLATPEETGVDTHKMLMEVAVKQSQWKKSLHHFESVVNYLMLISLVTHAATSLNPGLARFVAKSGFLSATLQLLGFSVAGGFGVAEFNHLFDEFVDKPSELSLLESIRDTHFASTAVMKNETAGLLDTARRGAAMANELSVTNAFGFTFKWLFHSVGFAMGLQAMKSLWGFGKWSVGGARNMLIHRGWFMDPDSLVQARFEKIAALLGQNPGPGVAFETVKDMGRAEALERLLVQYQKTLGASLDSSGALVLNAETAQALKGEVDMQLRRLASELNLNPETLLPALDRTKRVDDALRVARNTNEANIELLYNLRTRLGESARPSLRPEELRTVLVNAADHTPGWYQFVGVPWKKSNAATRLVGRVSPIAQAELDILALHDPELFAHILRVNAQLGAGKLLTTRDLFSRRSHTALTDLPPDVQRTFLDIKDAALADAEAATQALKASGEVSYVPDIVREQAHVRTCFDDIFRGQARPTTQALADRFVPQVRDLRSVHGGHAMDAFQNAFLYEHQMLPSVSARVRLQATAEMELWLTESQADIAFYAQRKGVTREQVIQWMLDPKHPDFAPRTRGPKAAVEDTQIALAVQPPAAEVTLADRAETLRDLLYRHPWQTDMDLIHAIARGDYAMMAQKLQRPLEFRMTQNRPQPPGSSPEGGSGDGEFGPTGPASDDIADSLLSDEAWAAKQKQLEAAEKARLQREAHAVGESSSAAPRPRARANGTPLDDLSDKEIVAAARRAKNRAETAKTTRETTALMHGDLPADLRGTTLPEGSLLSRRGDAILASVPEADRAFVATVLKQNASSDQLKRALARYRISWGAVVGPQDDVIRGMRLAIAHTEALELLARVPADAEAAAHRFMLERYLSKTDKILNAPLSHVEALEIYGLYGKKLPKTSQGIKDMHFTVNTRVSNGPLVTRAEAVLSAGYARSNSVTSIAQASEVLGIPVEYLGSVHIQRVVLGSAGPMDGASQTAARRILRALYQNHGQYVANEAAAAELWAAGDNLGVMNPRQMLSSMQAELETLLASNINASDKHLQREALRRVRLCLPFVPERRAVSMAVSMHTVEYPRLNWTTTDANQFRFTENAWFQEMAKRYNISQELIEQAQNAGYTKFRQRLLELEFDPKITSVKESAYQLSRLMHSTLVIENAIRSGAISSEEAVATARSLFEVNYIAGPRVQFTLFRYEAQWVEKQFKVLAAQRDTAPEFLRAIQSRLQEARLIEELTATAGSRELEGLESLALHSYSQTPAEVLIALNQRMVSNPAISDELLEFSSHLLDGSSQLLSGKWSSFSRTLPGGTKRVVRYNKAGELYQAAYGDSRAWNPDEAFKDKWMQTTRAQIEEQLYQRAQWALDSGNPLQIEAVSEAALRFRMRGASAGPTGPSRVSPLQPRRQPSSPTNDGAEPPTSPDLGSAPSPE